MFKENRNDLSNRTPGHSEISDIAEETRILRRENENLRMANATLKIENDKKTKMIAELTKWIKNLSDLNRTSYAETINKINQVISVFFLCEVVGFEVIRNGRRLSLRAEEAAPA
eukprot:TRINITY_DN7444_c0_g1_i2.p1 TRINITY_DN7444_c0_g1~~TRINITY_DN7444_c0_g1_i2.p1  ORF type:complete len:114 (-),score=26.44 TRINITY_DN7444_c0_g1_i2:494-835(-)